MAGSEAVPGSALLEFQNRATTTDDDTVRQGHSIPVEKNTTADEEGPRNAMPFTETRVIMAAATGRAMRTIRFLVDVSTGNLTGTFVPGIPVRARSLVRVSEGERRRPTV